MHEVGESFADASAFARGLAAGPARASLAAMEQMYGAGLDARSHGEAFLALFQSRLVPNGLYLLDEPEAALSPQSQLALIALIAETVADNCQFILATHSPILLAYPHATIYSFDRVPIERVRYEELQHVNVTRDFLNDPASYLRRLMPRDAAE
jgi:predicted ATPase